MKGVSEKIVLLHASNTFNNGSFMMLISFVYHLQKNLPPDRSVEIWLEMSGRENLDRFFKALGDDFAKSDSIQIRILPFQVTMPDHNSLLVKGFNLYNKYFTHIRFFRKKGISAIVVLGGDDISEYYKRWLIVTDLFRIYRYTKYFKTFLAGQTIGPFKGWRKIVAARCLARAVIYSRDGITTRYLQEKLGHPGNRLVDSSDLAFADLPGQFRMHGLPTYDLQPNHYIALVPGGFYSLYTPDKERYLLCWVKLIETLHKEADIQGKKLVFLPHVTRPEDDREIIFRLKGMLPRSDFPTDFIVEELMPHVLRQILGNSFFTISCRMHAAVSAFQMGKPAIGIGYSVKYNGVIGNSLGMPALVVQASGGLFDDPDRFAETVMHAVRFVISNYTAICLALRKKIPTLRNKAEEQIRSIADSLFK